MIRERKVRRFYVHGKGFSSLRRAAKWQALHELWDVVFGIPCGSGPDGMRERPRLQDAIQRLGDKQSAMAALYARHFKARDNRFCDTCNPTPYGYPDWNELCWECHQRAWVNARTEEIMKAYKEQNNG